MITKVHESLGEGNTNIWRYFFWTNIILKEFSILADPPVAVRFDVVVELEPGYTDDEGRHRRT